VYFPPLISITFNIKLNISILISIAFAFNPSKVVDFILNVSKLMVGIPVSADIPAL